MNLPNAITVGRIFLVPLLVVVLLTSPKDYQLFGLSKEAFGALIFAIASLSDWLDGYLARRRKQVTGLGQWMDPMADKLLVTAALVSLVYLELAPAWMAVVILGREFAVTVLRSVAHARGQTLPASPMGKVKMVAQVVAVLILLLSPGQVRAVYIAGHVALWIATIAALISAVAYSRRINAIVAAPPNPVIEPEARPSTPSRDRISA